MKSHIRKTGSAIRDAWLMLGLTILFFLFIEGSLRAAYFVKSRLAAAPAAAGRSTMPDTYQGADWVAGYQKEFNRSTPVRWMPYVYWRRVPFNGRFVNVDSSGVRRTDPVPAAPPDGARPLRIFMFGGSTVWGTGARDAFTIPSIVARQLAAAGVPADVTNYGESGFVSTQEVITLMLQIQKGNIPDLVIFYDGVNDTFSAFQQRVSGIPVNEFNRVIEFNLSNDHRFRDRTRMVVRDIAARLVTIRTATRVLGIDRRRGRAVEAQGQARNDAEEKALADGVAATYRANMELVKALSERFGFDYLFYWQPSIYQKTQLTEFERAIPATGGRFFAATYDAVRHRMADESRFHDLSLIFADVSAPLFIDAFHLGESGNELIGGRIAADVLGLIGPSDQTRDTSSILSGQR
jgi:lysophospholipase L1-like esterase